MQEERAEALAREQAVRDALATPREIGGTPSEVTTTSKQEEKTSPKSEEIMIPKYRYDEVNSEYNKLKSQVENMPKAGSDIEAIIEQKLAPIKVQLEVDQVIKAHPDFSEYASKALERIKTKPALSLEEAYQLEKFSQLESKSIEQGKNEAYQNIDRKSSLQAERSTRKVESPSVEDMISDKNVPLSEIAKMLPRS